MFSNSCQKSMCLFQSVCAYTTFVCEIVIIKDPCTHIHNFFTSAATEPQMGGGGTEWYRKTFRMSSSL